MRPRRSPLLCWACRRCHWVFDKAVGERWTTESLAGIHSLHQQRRDMHTAHETHVNAINDAIFFFSFLYSGLWTVKKNLRYLLCADTIKCTNPIQILCMLTIMVITTVQSKVTILRPLTLFIFLSTPRDPAKKDEWLRLCFWEAVISKGESQERRQGTRKQENNQGGN